MTDLANNDTVFTILDCSAVPLFYNQFIYFMGALVTVVYIELNALSLSLVCPRGSAVERQSLASVLSPSCA